MQQDFNADYGIKSTIEVGQKNNKVNYVGLVVIQMTNQFVLCCADGP
jgi:hypothetical protein